MKYKNFGRGSGIRVSELALGCGMFGERWGYGADLASSREMFNIYAEAGGNFLDTSDTYQNGQSEEWLGQFLEGRRNDFVLGSKYTLGGPGKGAHTIGNSRQVMIKSVEDSLKRLKTDCIDLYWVHMPDAVTSTDEIIRGLNDLVSAGKINYIGFSDFPAWRVARAATIAEIRGWASVIGLQMEYSLVERTPDRELVPMAEALGLGMVGWSPLGGGLLTGKYRRGEEGRATTFKRLIHAEDEAPKVRIVDAVISIADELGVTPGQVATAWIGTRGIIPILGPRTPEQLKENLATPSVQLDAQQIARLDVVSAVPLGFPHEMMSQESQVNRLAGGNPDAIEPPILPVA